jgi:hypothetical protein
VTRRPLLRDREAGKIIHGLRLLTVHRPIAGIGEYC